VDGRPRQIIGVLPKGFRFFDREDDALYLPMQWDRSKTKLGNFSYQALARLKPGVTMEEASADMARLLPIAIRSFPAPEGVSAKIFESARLAPRLRPLKKDVVGDVGEVLWVLMGSIGMVLLIACANVANLLLVRVEGRRQELAIRSALGAGWRAVVGDLLVESATLGLMGSLLGLGLAYGGLKVLVATAPTGLPRIQEIGLDLPVLLFTLVLAVLCSLLIAAIPVFKFGGTQLNSGLREGGRSSSQSRDQHRARNALVVLQVALALVLLICSGLMIRTFLALSHVAPGFEDPHSLQTFRLSVPESKISDAQGERMVRAQQDIQNRIAAVPGVTAVSYGSMVPMSGSNSKDVLTAQDHPDVDAKVPPIRRFKFVAPGYLSTLGTHLVAGRDLTWSETLGKRPVAMISENFAKEYWGSASGAIGKRIRVATLDDWRQIVGVVENVHDDGVNKDAPSTVYWPVLMGNFEGSKERTQGYITFVVRTQRAGSELLMKEVQQAVWSVNPNVPLADVYTLDHFYTRSMARTSFTLVMLSVAGSMALLLGFVGIYGVIAYSVSQRTREIGIRMALGAQRQMIISMFVRNGLVLTAVGVGFGLVAALMAMRLMSSLLFHVSAIDPLTYSVITLAIVVVAYVACYLPSRRAATVDPVDALRSE
jgi:predicted permease